MSDPGEYIRHLTRSELVKHLWRRSGVLARLANIAEDGRGLPEARLAALLAMDLESVGHELIELAGRYRTTTVHDKKLMDESVTRALELLPTTDGEGDPGFWGQLVRCCDLHQDTECCDEYDCGPCCAACPTCPTRPRTDEEGGQ